ncbi:MAG: hypothetical protein IJQ73_15050, partial [Kiritimatiellae bacterium]|nr:hypothetical protein [Kiritimatiellia bacterium]
MKAKFDTVSNLKNKMVCPWKGKKRPPARAGGEIKTKSSCRAEFCGNQVEGQIRHCDEFEKQDGFGVEGKKNAPGGGRGHEIKLRQIGS